MKQINGTITLSFVEEDNKQRVIFRVVPLCTREGVLFKEATAIFPDQASLRIVPDKREQSTFKERMRSMGSLCAIELIGNEGKELSKVRQNRNYDPAQGEENQYAIYSDVIYEFAPGAVYEVLEWHEDGVQVLADTLLTSEVLLLCNKVLYGPVPNEMLESVTLSTLKPFGNENFLLHTVEFCGRGCHSIYWNPEDIIGWRQRRGSLRRKMSKPGEDAGGNEQQLAEMENQGGQATAAVTPPEIENVVREKGPAIIASKKADFVEDKQPEESPAAPDPIPIGTKLDILDASISFEEHISRLAQPLSDQANRLAEDAEGERPPEMLARFSGTPIVRDTAHMPRTISRPQPLHHVVDQQMRKKNHGAVKDETSYNVECKRVENPVENLLMALDEAWQNQDTREQAIAALLENQGFVDPLVNALQHHGYDMSAITAAYAQLNDIEAERLSILMELDTAKSAEKQYKEKLITNTIEKKKQEIGKLTQETQKLLQEKEKLESDIRMLSESTVETATDLLGQCLTGLCMETGNRILLSPVVGTHYDIKPMVECVRLGLGECGYQVDEDGAAMLLIAFSLFSTICLKAESTADAQRFADAFLQVLGLQSVSAAVRYGAEVAVASFLPEDGLRTPTVSLQLPGTETLSVYGHKTVFLLDDATLSNSNALSPLASYPVIEVPAVRTSAILSTPQTRLEGAASISSFVALSTEMEPLLDEGEAWLAAMKDSTIHVNCPLPDAVILHMRRFVSVASRKMRGGFLAAADMATLQWIVPLFVQHNVEMEQVQTLLGSLPRSLESVVSKV